MRATCRAVVVLVLSLVLLPIAARAQANPDWHRAIPGFKIAGNLYYVGTADLAAYLIATPPGNILINGNFKEDVPAIRQSIEGLGFKGTVRPSQPGARQVVADLRRGNVTIELFQLADAAPLPESRKNPSEDFRTHGVKHFGFEVKNLPAVLAALKAKGVKMAFEMRDTPTTAFAFISDNAGNAIELIEHKTR